MWALGNVIIFLNGVRGIGVVAWKTKRFEAIIMKCNALNFLNFAKFVARGFGKLTRMKEERYQTSTAKTLVIIGSEELRKLRTGVTGSKRFCQAKLVMNRTRKIDLEGKQPLSYDIRINQKEQSWSSNEGYGYIKTSRGIYTYLRPHGRGGTGTKVIKPAVI